MVGGMYGDAVLREALARREKQRLLRTLSQPLGVDFSSNDYLALARDKGAMAAGQAAVESFGTGSTGSRLLSGNKAIFEDFEQRIAQDKQAEGALIFNSGYVANASVIAALLRLKYRLFFDKLNHASMYPSDPQHIGRDLFRFPHLNYAALAALLEKHGDYPKKVIVSETIFGMDGDKADLAQLVRLAEKYKALLYLDEAHATGLYGPQGYGLSTQVSLNPRTTLIMGTFSKALASSGAYVACPQIFKTYLLQVSRSFIYSTALSPFSIGVAQYNWERLPQLGTLRKHVFQLAEHLRRGFADLGRICAGQGTNIIPVLFDSTDAMLLAHRFLQQQGIITSAIRPPTSPTPRLRFAINAGHTEEQVAHLLELLSALP